MSAVAFIKGMIEAGFSCEQALRAAEVFETTAAAMKPVRSKAAARQARYEERKRQKASENVSPDASDDNDASDAPLSLPPSDPPTTHPYPRERDYPRARKGRPGLGGGFGQRLAGSHGRQSRQPALRRGRLSPPGLVEDPGPADHLDPSGSLET